MRKLFVVPFLILLLNVSFAESKSFACWKVENMIDTIDARKARLEVTKELSEMYFEDPAILSHLKGGYLPDVKIMQKIFDGLLFNLEFLTEGKSSYCRVGDGSKRNVAKEIRKMREEIEEGIETAKDIYEKVKKYEEKLKRERGQDVGQLDLHRNSHPIKRFNDLEGEIEDSPSVLTV